MQETRFESIGVYLPEKIVTTQSLIDQMETKPMFDLERLTGIRERRWRAEDEDSYSLALKASRCCLANSQYEASDLDVIIYCSITRFKGTFFQLEPAFSKSIKTDLSMRASAINFDITNACAGMMTGVYILNSMIKSGAVKRGMVVSGECITPITETAIKEIREPIDFQFASLTVGDSGAACILDQNANKNERISIVDLSCFSQHSELCLGMPSDHHAGIAMYTDAMSIHKEAIERMPRLLQYYADKYQVDATDFDYVIVHQTSKRAITTALELCVPLFQKEGNPYFPETLISLDKYGNTSSTSHFVVLYDYLQQGKIKPGSRVLFIILASGLMMGIVAATIGHMEVTKWVQ